MDVKLSDSVLLNRYLTGEQSAISQLIERHSPRVRSYIRMMVKDHDLAEDLFQETFIKAVKVVDQGRYADNGRFLSWVLRIAHNIVIDHFRSKKSSHTIGESEAGYDVLGSLKFASEPIEDKIVHQQIADDVRRLVDFLPQGQQEVVRMRYYYDMSFKEIAEQSGVSINTALGRMRYALINMRRMVKEKNIILS
ncbi:MAG: sigma-70 family RNA polymerase sigma factor [Rikenellaceae bacterium]